MKDGFSLIELLCVLTIVGLLATFAYPSYTQHLTRTQRIDGQTALLDLATRLEQYYTHAHTYKTATLGTGKITDVLNTQLSPNKHYILNIIATHHGYQLTATATGVQAIRDTQCKKLTLNARGEEGPHPTCWTS
ncbi:MAG: type IV pilin protein [Legionellaceae bacterium]|nr:type IV pilin protein [Legionellaceae bacterium]